MSRALILKIVSFILFWAAILHFTNFILGGIITGYGYIIPVYFSLLISMILAYLGYKVKKLNADFL